MKHKLLKNSKGLTLVELLISLVILLLVLSVVYNFFFVNMKAYDIAERRSEIQFDVRMASDFITSSVRNATLVSITDNSLANVIDLTSLQTQFDKVISVLFEVRQHSGRYFVWYKIIGRDASGELEYELTSDVLLNNIYSATLSSGDAIYYQ